jgi:hypothetical protein
MLEKLETAIFLGGNDWRLDLILIGSSARSLFLNFIYLYLKADMPIEIDNLVSIC